MTRKNDVTIILPNYNSQLYLEKTLKSVISQTYQNWKLLIVDDNSNLETKKILNGYIKHKKIKIIFLTVNRGAAYCRNLALKKIKSKYIAFIDSDDIWKKNKLKLQIDFMKKNGHKFTYTCYETIGQKKRKIYPPEKLNYENFIGNTSISTSTMIIEKKIIKNIRFAKTKVCEDYFFKCRILKRISYAFCLNKILTKYRVRDDSLQSNNFKNLYWIWKINSKYNKLNFFKNIFSIFSISSNSFKRYGLKNIFNLNT